MLCRWFQTFVQSGSIEPQSPDVGAEPKVKASPGLSEWALFEQIPMFAEATMEAITSTTTQLCQGVVNAAGNARKSFLADSV